MQRAERSLPATKTVALVAHDGCKPKLLAWCEANAERLKRHNLIGTGTTATLITEKTGLEVRKLLSGPLGGDQQLGAMISEGRVHALVFFWDPLNAAPHDPDVKALLRLATLWNIPIAMNEATADAIIASAVVAQEYTTRVPDGLAYVSVRSDVLGGDIATENRS